MVLNDVREAAEYCLGAKMLGIVTIVARCKRLKLCSPWYDKSKGAEGVYRRLRLDSASEVPRMSGGEPWLNHRSLRLFAPSPRPWGIHRSRTECMHCFGTAPILWQFLSIILR